jgi:hypothetical protein
MDKFTKLCELFEVYGFYPSDHGVVCVKVSDNTKHFITKSGCDCKGFKIKGVCKHWNMLKGVWTPQHGTPEWFESMLGDIIEPMNLPEFFNSAIVKMELPHGFQMACFTIKYEKYSMGVQIIDPFTFEQKNFYKGLYED